MLSLLLQGGVMCICMKPDYRGRLCIEPFSWDLHPRYSFLLFEGRIGASNLHKTQSL